MFGRVKCKICGDQVRFALKHLRDKHEDVLERDMKTMKMQRIMKKYFD